MLKARFNILSFNFSKKIARAFMVFAVFFTIVVPAQALTSADSPIRANKLHELICLAVNFLSSTLMPPLAVIFVMWAGILYLTASGRPEMIKNANVILVSVVIGVAVLLLAPALVSVAVNVAGSPSGAPSGVNISDICSRNVAAATVTAAFVSLINWLSWFFAAVSVVMGIYTAFLFLLSRGDPARAKQATSSLVFTIIGVAIAVLSFSIVSIIRLFIE